MNSLLRAFYALVLSFGVHATPLSKSGIPFIALSSGSVSASGVVTGITALPTAYAAAYCYLPQNIVATASAAAWQFCTCTTTACTVYLNSYTGGTPVVPKRLTPVVAGQGAYTGVTSEVFGPRISVPANTLGELGGLEVTANWSASPYNGNAKNVRIRYSGTVGQPYTQSTLTWAMSLQSGVFIDNRGTTAQQVGTSIAPNGGYGANGGNFPTYAAFDTSVWTEAVFSFEKAVATDNLILERYSVGANAIRGPPETSRIYVAEGDSITWGDVAYARQFMANAAPGTQLFDLAIPGCTLADAIARQAQALQVKASNPNAVAIFSALIGGNGFAGAGTQGLLDQIASLASYYDTFRNAGFKTICVTWPPRTTTGFNAARNQVNAAMRGWLGTHCDAIADAGGDPIMGPDSAASHTTLYIDGIHPSAYGHSIFETTLRPIVNGF